MACTPFTCTPPLSASDTLVKRSEPCGGNDLGPNGAAAPRPLAPPTARLACNQRASRAGTPPARWIRRLVAGWGVGVVVNRRARRRRRGGHDFQLRPTTTGASLRWHRDVSWVCGGCTATPGASRRRKTQVPARVLCLSGSCRLSHAEKHGSQRAKGAAVPARAGQMKVSHVWEFSRARSASRRTRTGPRQPRAWAHLGTGLHLSHFCRRYTNVLGPRFRG